MNPYTKEQKQHHQIKLHLVTSGALLESLRIKRQRLSDLDREYIAQAEKMAAAAGMSRRQVNEFFKEGMEEARKSLNGGKL